MSETIKTFESELRNKLLFKSSSKVSPEVVLFKACKFFDLYNNGQLTRRDFFKAIVKCGVVIDTYDLDTLYDYYDADKTGKINYKQFTQNLLLNDLESSEDMSKSSLSMKKSQPLHSRFQGQRQISHDQKSSSRYNQSFSQSPSKNLYTPQEVYDWVQRQLRGDGICGLLNFANNLKSTDEHKTHLITPDKLRKFLPFLASPNVESLISNFNPNKFGEVNYAELIYSIKGNMTEKRQRMVDQVFQMLDSRQEGQIQIEKLIYSYKNKSEISEFKRSIAAYEKFQSIDDGIFTDEDFNDYFEFLSFGFPEDLSFQQFIRIGFYGQELARSSASSRSSRQRQFGKQKDKQSSKYHEPMMGNFKKVKEQQSSPISHIDNSPKQKLEESHFEKMSVQSKQSVSSKRSSVKPIQTPAVKEIQMILLRMKKRLASKGTKGFLFFEKSLKHYDTDEDGLINLQQFKNVVKDQKVDITGTEAHTIFNIFNHEKSGLINYQELVHTLKGQQTIERRQIFERLWERVQVDEEATTFSKIKSCLSFRNHPDIQTGRRYDDEIFGQIKDTIMMIQDLNGQPRSDFVLRDAFEQYCENLSLSLPENQLFQSIATNFWKIESIHKIEDQYAGSRKLFDPSQKGYLQDHHRYAIKGGSVTDNAPFGTFNGPTNYSTQHQRL